MKKPELLAPAGDLERLKVAFAYGADAVYIGGKLLSMRVKARNFSHAEIEAGISYAHSLGKKIYVAVNICAHNADFSALDEYLAFLGAAKADALLISDAGVFARARKTVPQMPIHISTQANVTNFAAAEFWRGLGAKRIVLARELSLEEIAEIRAKVGVEIEAFVHGAMCMAYSGRCLLSNFLNSRDANRGECSQPCRFEYELEPVVNTAQSRLKAPISSDISDIDHRFLVERKSGAAFRVFEDGRGTHVFNSKDLNMVAFLPELVAAGVDCLKIEGRMKTEYYVGAVTKTYREALDDFFDEPGRYAEKIPFYRAELEKVSNRGYTTGFFFGRMRADDHDYTGENQAASQDFIGIVEACGENNLCLIEQRNKFARGDKIEVLRARGENFTQIAENMYDENLAEINSAPHPKQRIFLKLDKPAEKLDMVRRA